VHDVLKEKRGPGSRRGDQEGIHKSSCKSVKKDGKEHIREGGESLARQGRGRTRGNRSSGEDNSSFLRTRGSLTEGKKVTTRESDGEGFAQAKWRSLMRSL